MREWFGTLWNHTDFRKLWLAQSISVVGTQVSLLAIPLTAAMALDAGPFEMGLLVAAEAVPALLLGLPAGAWVDRHRRRPVLIGADLGRGALLLLIPVAAWLGILRLEHLYAIVLLVGALSLLFDLATQSYLPALIPRDRLVEGNSKLGMSESIAEVAGPGLAGGLVQLLSGPIAIGVDALSYLTSGLCLSLIRTPELAAVHDEEPAQGFWAEIRLGLVVLVGNSVLRAIGGSTGSWNFWYGAIQAVFILYATEHLGLEPVFIGVAAAVGSAGAVVGALASEEVASRFGVGRSAVASLTLAGLGWAIVPLAGGPVTLVMVLLAAAEFLTTLGVTTFQIQQVSLRQAVTPHHLQGRVNATMRLLIDGGAPLGALLGGALGEAVGLRMTLVLGAVGMLLAVPWIVMSPLRSLRELPESADAGA